MLRAFLSVVFFVTLQGVQAQQVQPHGVPASITSPSPDGTLHGVPASITSPTIAPGINHRAVVFDGRRPRQRFGNPRLHNGRRTFVPVPIFIPAYSYPTDSGYSEADPPVADMYAPADAPAENPDALRDAYNRGAHDALVQQQADSRYGEHYFDSREKNAAPKSPAAADKKAEKPAVAEPSPAPEPKDESPAAVFIFKDGHKLETQNFAIVGQTLIDLSGSGGLKKIKLAELDLDATRKANDDLGISLRLP